MVGGGFTTYNGTMANGIVRLAANGSIDNSFVTGTGFDGMVTSALLQTDGKIIVAGQFTSYNGTPVNKILRLKKNGSIDNTFSLNGLANKAPQKMTLQADGKIVLAYSTIEEVDLKRLNTDGSIDGSYSAIIPITDPDGVDTYFPTTRALLTQSDGKILVGGSYFFGNSPSFHFLKRVNVNGMLDTTFHSPYEEQAISGGGPVFTICLQNDGKIIVGGKGEEHSNGSQNLSTSFISRLNVNGSLDNTFHQNNTLSKPNLGVYTTEILTDGKIIVAGFFPELNTYAAHNIARLNTDGTFDISFNKITGANGEIMASAVQPNGRIIIAGNFSAFHFQSRNHVARLLENGKLDHSFNVGTGTNGTVSAVAVQADKKILIAGNFSSYNDHPVPGLVRVNSNGSIDASFDPGTGADGPINTIVVQDDNKIVIGGSFTQVNGNNSNA
ncbi:MAG TPA: delta-60 repeat domain-containing protein, partial [Bacteroidia bacterium]|nr:delta-60 repeat domain-containing protein [Bacteroidia bacterium]